MSSVGGASSHLALHHAEFLGERALQTSGVESCECSHLSWFESRIEESYETSEVSRVKDDDHVLHVRAVGLDVLTQFLSDFAVASEEVLTSHTFLTRCTTRRDDVFCILECLCHVGGSHDVDIAETALSHFLSHSFRREHIIEADVASKSHHEGSLYHIGADHTSSTHNH